MFRRRRGSFFSNSRNARRAAKAQLRAHRKDARWMSIHRHRQDRLAQWKRIFRPFMPINLLYFRAAFGVFLSMLTRMTPTFVLDDSLNSIRRPRSQRRMTESVCFLGYEQLEQKQLLAADLLYVDNPVDFVITTGTMDGSPDAGDTVTWLGNDGAIGGIGGDADVPDLIFGTHAFGALEDAVVAANDSDGFGDVDEIRIGPGNFSIASQIVIDDDLQISGAGKFATTLLSGFDTSSSGDARGWFLVNSGEEFSAFDLTFDGNGQKVWQAVRHKGSGSFNNVAFEDIQFDASGPSYAGNAIAAFGAMSDIDVVNSSFANIGRIGVLYFGAGTTGQFENNTYTGKGAGDHLDYALDISAGAHVNVLGNTITNNLGVASSDGSTSAGVLVSTFFGGGTVANIQNNFITGNTTGVFIGYDASDSSTVTIHSNDLSGNTTGAISTNPVVEASGNYWGVSGPVVAGAGTVNTAPYLTSGTDTQPGVPGFQGDFTSLTTLNQYNETSESGFAGFSTGPGWSGSITNVTTGTGGVTSLNGSTHAIFTQTNEGGGLTGPFSRFDGYRANLEGGIITQVKIYLDPAALAAGEGFDFSVAASNDAGGHLQDYIFHVTKDTSTGDLLVGTVQQHQF